MGMKQRLGIASTLLRDPELIILDEPTNGLDPAGTKEIRDLIPKLAEESRAVLLCSHLLHEVELVCSRVAIIKQGTIIANAPIKELLSRGNILQIKVNDIEKATAILRGLPWIKSVKIEGDYLMVDVPGDRSGEVNLALAQKGIMVAELVNRTASLESVFLELTGGASGD
jgi:ABC-2 type transport system ATP-binding protein